MNWRWRIGSSRSWREERKQTPWSYSPLIFLYIFFYPRSCSFGRILLSGGGYNVETGIGGRFLSDFRHQYISHCGFSLLTSLLFLTVYCFFFGLLVFRLTSSFVLQGCFLTMVCVLSADVDGGLVRVFLVYRTVDGRDGGRDVVLRLRRG